MAASMESWSAVESSLGLIDWRSLPSLTVTGRATTKPTIAEVPVRRQARLPIVRR